MQKRDLDFSQPESSSIILNGKYHRSSIQLFAEGLRDAHEKAFGAALEVAHMEIQKHAKLEKDFVAVFTGGSVRNKGVPSVVSAGAALSQLNVPPVVDLLSDSAIAIPLTVLRDGKRVSYSKADFIFSKGCRASSAYLVYHADVLDDPGLQFSLVCHLNYEKNRIASDTKPQRKRRGNGWLQQSKRRRRDSLSMPPVMISAPLEVLNGPLSPYDLDFFVNALDLLGGDLIRFRLSGKNIERLAT
ncbi:hypothetical protein F5Y14DRAFT_457293 [Nemania sp. NC0429]|nr:hypothetical protein F5Y14DRAFT_457293 [Nemania sp. NC0429]